MVWAGGLKYSLLLENNITERKITKAIENSGAVFMDNTDEIGNSKQ